MTDHSPDLFDDRTRSLARIDHAVSAAKEAAHGCRSAEGREHFEFALALLRESWIAESGQRARTAAQVIGDVQQGLRMIAAIIGRKGEWA